MTLDGEHRVFLYEAKAYQLPHIAAEGNIEPRMFNRYYQDELSNLRDLGAEFARKHPALGPMLAGASSDPDVERILEGTAFLTGLLREKLDDDFPEIVHELMQIIWPHYLRPMPASTILAFTPKAAMKSSMKVPAGTFIASVPVEGTQCLFQTCYPVNVHPLKLVSASYHQPPGGMDIIELSFELLGMKLSEWHPESLGFHLGGDYVVATELFYLLQQRLAGIALSSPDGEACFLPSQHMQSVGFKEQEGIIPYPMQSFPGYRLLQEYFLLPEKFFFFRLFGWERWQSRGEGSAFTVRLELKEPPKAFTRLKNENFILSATPAVNLFPMHAKPIRLDHRQTEFPVQPDSSRADHYQVYSVTDVVGIIHGTAEQRAYVPFDLYNPEPKDRPVYHVIRKRSPVHQGLSTFITVDYPNQNGLPRVETLSMELLCTNGSLTESLQVGDIRLPTSNTPEFVDCSNVRTPKPGSLPPMGQNLLWRFLSHLSLNYLSLARTENLKALLELYLFPETRDQKGYLANRKRLDGLERVLSRPKSKLVSGVMMRGQEIRLSLRQDHFTGRGDLFLFCSVLNSFLGSYASINAFTELTVEESVSGEEHQWPARIGDRPLI